jgi:hypothetical protein
MYHNSLMQAINCSSFAFLESRLLSAFVCFLWGASSGTPCISLEIFLAVQHSCVRTARKNFRQYICPLVYYEGNFLCNLPSNEYEKLK